MLCKCQDCGRTFDNMRSMNFHRTGAIPNRRCMTNVEMIERGMYQGQNGRWSKKLRTPWGENFRWEEKKDDA